jgi:hypothetical protein
MTRVDTRVGGMSRIAPGAARGSAHPISSAPCGPSRPSIDLGRRWRCLPPCWRSRSSSSSWSRTPWSSPSASTSGLPGRDRAMAVRRLVLPVVPGRRPLPDQRGRHPLPAGRPLALRAVRRGRRPGARRHPGRHLVGGPARRRGGRRRRPSAAPAGLAAHRLLPRQPDDPAEIWTGNPVIWSMAAWRWRSSERRGPPPRSCPEAEPRPVALPGIRGGRGGRGAVFCAVPPLGAVARLADDSATRRAAGCSDVAGSSRCPAAHRPVGPDGGG